MPIVFAPDRLVLQERGPEGPDEWVVQGPLSMTGLDGDPVTVKDKFITDLASVPHFLTWLVPRYGLHTKAAVVHDCMCQQKCAVSDRFEADDIFRRVMISLGVSPARAWLMWTAVMWATILGKLVCRVDLTLVSVIAMWISISTLEPTSHLGTSGWAFVAAASFVLIAFICFRSTTYRPLRLLRCYVLTPFGLLLAAPGIALLPVLFIINLIELFSQPQRLLHRWMRWLSPLAAAVTAALLLFLTSFALFRRSGGRIPAAATAALASLEDGSPREQRMRQLLAQSRLNTDT